MKQKSKNNNRRTLFLTSYCFNPSRKISNAAILCEGNKISAIGNASCFTPDPDIDIYDLRDTYAVPGFIDTHIHGAGGFDSSTSDEGIENINLMCNTLAKHGVTSFLPTIVSRSKHKFKDSISALCKLIDKYEEGAKPLGMRLEGPFLNRQKGGSQNNNYIRSIDLEELKDIIAEGKNKIKIMTFAPELNNSIKLVEMLRENNIIPSMGHTMADEHSVNKAIDAGATHCTHLYNGMPSLHHRSVGISGVAMTDNRVTTEIIIDGYHIHPRMIDIVSRTKPKNKIIGISDAIQGAGLKDGKYHLGKTKITVKNGRAKTSDGTMAGTTLTLERGWDILVRYSQLDIKDAAACLTINPARLLNETKIGELKPGRIANIAFFNIKDNKAILTVNAGKIIFVDKSKNLQCKYITK